MQSVVVGTAGHIDHGKSSLVHALTGIDPDRLKEEKARGITIELGFAHTTIGATRVAFVDVPGHERFVRTMLAGVGGIDCVLLIVAADESVMPQTREHFDICKLLRIPRGIVVITKSDLADAETRALVAQEVGELVQGSFLERADVIEVSSTTGDGLDALRGAIAAQAARVTNRPVDGVTRLPIDRAFSMKGFGTVVTGTLVSGRIAPDDELEVLPQGRKVKVRGIQVHGRFSNDKAEYFAGVFNGNAASRTSNDNTRLQYNARLSVEPLGRVAYSEAAFEGWEKPLLAIAAQFEHNDLGGASNLTDLNTTILGADLVYKYRGFSLFGEYFNRKRKPEAVSGTSSATSGAATLSTGSFHSNGYNFEAGYFLKRDKAQIAVRFAGIGTQRQLAFS